MNSGAQSDTDWISKRKGMEAFGMTPGQIRSRIDVKAFYAIRFYCGPRLGEVIALRWSDYDGETLSVNKQIVQGHYMPQTKTHSRRIVNVHTFARRQLQALARAMILLVPRVGLEPTRHEDTGT